MTPTESLAQWLVEHRYEVTKTNTPLDILAAHMLASLALFEQSLLDRANHEFYNPAHAKPKKP